MEKLDHIGMSMLSVCGVRNRQKGASPKVAAPRRGDKGGIADGLQGGLSLSFAKQGTSFRVRD